MAKRSEGVARPVKVRHKYTRIGSSHLKRIRYGQAHGHPVRDVERVKNASKRIKAHQIVKHGVKTVKTQNGPKRKNAQNAKKRIKYAQIR